MILEIAFSLMLLQFSFRADGTHNFNINNEGKKTTFGDEGYDTYIKVGDWGNEPAEYITEKGVKDVKGINFKTSSMPWGDKYIRIIYTAKNNNNYRQKFSLATVGDIQLDNNDKAPVFNMVGNRGFTMKDGTTAIEVFLRDTYGVTNVDTYWYGYTVKRYYKVWVSGTDDRSTYSDYKTDDSAMTFSWQNRWLEAGETTNLSFILGFGPFYNHPMLKISKYPVGSFLTGSTVSFSGTLQHYDAGRKGLIYVTIDGTNQQTIVNNLDISMKTASFSGTYTIPSTTKAGERTLTIWAVDDRGQPSESYSYKITVVEPPPRSPMQTPQQTPSNTPSTTPSITPSSTPSTTPSMTPSDTPSITPSTTPSETLSNTPSMTPETTPIMTPNTTPFNTPSSTPDTTPSETPSETPSTTPINSPVVTPYDTPNKSPLQTLSSTPNATAIVGPKDKMEDNDGKNFTTIIEKKWIILVIIASIVILALVSVFAIMLYALRDRNDDSEEEESEEAPMDPGNFTMDEEMDSGETVDISDQDVGKEDHIEI